METKETVKLGVIFERLMVNPDYKELHKFIVDRLNEITTGLSNVLLKSTEDMVNDGFNKGQLIGLAEGEAHMLSCIKMMKEEEIRKAKEKSR